MGQRAMLDEVQDAFFAVDWEYRLIHHNPAAGRLIDTALVADARPLFDLLPDARYSSAGEALRQAMQFGKPAIVEHQVDTQGGRWLELRIYPTSYGISIFARDVSERRRSEEDLRESLERLALTQQIAHIGSWELDLRSGRLTWSEEVYRIFGLQRREEVANYEAFLERVHSDDRAAVDAAYADSLNEGREGYEIDHRIVRADSGEVRFVYERCEHRRDEEGRVVRSLGIIQDVTERKRLEQELRQGEAEKARLYALEQQRRGRLEALRQALDVALSSPDAAEASQRMLDFLAAEHGFEYATVWLADDGLLELLASVGFPHGFRERISPLALTGPFDAVKVFTSGQPLIISDAATANPAVRELYADLGLALGSYVILPLSAHGATVGTLSFGWRKPHAVARDDLDYYLSLSGELGVVLENARLYAAQQRIATTLQEKLIHPLPEVEGLELAALSLPAHRSELVGGDFHDVFLAADERLVVLIGDVMGKGVQAAGLSETVHSAVRALALVTSSPAEILEYVNRLLLAEGHEQFVSVLLLVLDPRTGCGTMASAGHPAPVRVSHEDVGLLEPRYGPPLGVIETAYEERRYSLAKDEALILYTDGLTEARRDGALFGERRLLETLREVTGLHPATLIAHLRQAVLDHAGSLQDDLEMLVLRRVVSITERRSSADL
jgi:PAS domain S-box-containing protein